MVVYRTYRSDTRTRTGDENGFVEETGRIEEGHATDVSGAESILSKYIRCQLPGERLVAESSATMESHDDHHEVDEGDVQLLRWSRLLSWLGSHGMDLSPSAFHVERRPRTGTSHLASHRISGLTSSSLHVFQVEEVMGYFSPVHAQWVESSLRLECHSWTN